MLLEELDRFRWMLTGDIMERGCRNIICLPLSDKRVILKQVLELRGVKVGLAFQEIPGFPSGQRAKKDQSAYNQIQADTDIS